ncbi:MAG: alanine--tRNA ligase [Candidatus Eisenbacteria bacterium]|nr:alanine--tRNA ligase [Candidatus Eisenbacteria bacterium]
MDALVGRAARAAGGPAAAAAGILVGADSRGDRASRRAAAGGADAAGRRTGGRGGLALTAAEVRRAFVEFYRARDHHLVPSAPLAPQDDPSLLFTSAGMVPFKKYYAGSVALPYRRAVSVQKCLRVNDIEEVGHTPRHLTFFEMLGHFSFGDYFKREAIEWNWALFTRVLGLDPERLTASVYHEDEEAYAIWRDRIGLPPERIVRLGADDNFWGPAGGTGACGPCSELYYDLGPEVDPEHPDAQAGDETDRFVEVGNFVFPQFDRQRDGSDQPLKNRGIDTGIGLERLAMVIQGKTSVFESDLFRPIIERAAELCGVPPQKGTVAYRIIADHVRALTFALSEGVLPSNEGRGYVLRRLIRRAAVQGHHLGMREPFLHRLVEPVVAMMTDAYPEVVAGRERAELALRTEEERFGATLEQGLAKLEEALAEVGPAAAGGDLARSGGEGIGPPGVPQMPGETAFLLYDTYGLPLELLREIAGERSVRIDEESFRRRLEAQKERSRAATRFQFASQTLDWHAVSRGADSEFVGYDRARSESVVRRWAALPDDPEHLLVVLDRTPFYGEAGGQVGDTGILRSGEINLRVADTLREGEAEIRHVVALAAEDAGDRPHAGTDASEAPHPDSAMPDALAVREALDDADRRWDAVIDAERRDAIRRHHTATHLLHAALRETLGGHVTQAGSRVAPDRLRFDYTHHAALTPRQRAQIELRVNHEIVADRPVETELSTYEEAVRDGVIALFGEKYDVARVRRVRVPGVSEELCGGTHVRATGQIGALLLLEESAVSAGVRRLEAVCGLAALEAAQRLRAALEEVRGVVGTSAAEAPAKIEAMQTEIHRLRKELARARRGEGVSDLDALLREAEAIGPRKIVVGEVRADSVPALRELGDRVRQRLGSGAALLWGHVGEKTTFLAVVTRDLVDAKLLRADALVRAVAAVTGGGGGGPPHMALGGARDLDRLPEALEEGRRRMEAALRTDEAPEP